MRFRLPTTSAPAFLLAAAFIPSDLFAAAAQDPGPITVTAPAGLTDQQKREWKAINRDAEKLAKRMAKLRDEMADDRSDVAEAEKDLASAERKLKSERKDRDRTLEKFAKAEEALVELQQRRIALRK